MKLLSNSVWFKRFGCKSGAKVVRKLSFTQTKCYQNVNNSPKYRSEPMANNPSASGGGHPYDNLFQWTSLREFTAHLADNIVYFDGQLLAITKPWGVGTHRPFAQITAKTRHLSQVLYSGSPQYCIRESLEMLSQTLGVKRLKVIKTIDRFMSGVVLLVANELTENKVLKSLRRSTSMTEPSMSFWCVTKGYPTLTDAVLKERVGIKLLETDELGDHKHPIIIRADEMTNKMRRRKEPQFDGLVVQPALIELKTLAINRSLGVGLCQLSTNVQKWHFIECYLAFKTTFVLGDNRFSRQVKHILGTPLSVKPNKLSYSEDIEPLPQPIINKLSVKGNNHIPVHIHHKSITLPLYLSKKDKNDLIIESNKIPDYFEWTLKRLDLTPKLITN